MEALEGGPDFRVCSFEGRGGRLLQSRQCGHCLADRASRADTGLKKALACRKAADSGPAGRDCTAGCDWQGARSRGLGAGALADHVVPKRAHRGALHAAQGEPLATNASKWRGLAAIAPCPETSSARRQRCSSLPWGHPGRDGAPWPPTRQTPAQRSSMHPKTAGF